ncbi:VPS9 domain-containing protein 1 isoform X1 [Osmerus mordax]|uniref:VPS9 domain-containing protein 1 isoform X1 n=2 Tax=Osmerus mordax TaxID=8014 RepID=UPI003510725B
MAAKSGCDAGVKPLQNAMKMAKLAIQLDAGNRHKEAYCEYLKSISYISNSLLEDAMSQTDGEMVAVEVERMLRLAEQCLERAKSFIEHYSPTQTQALSQNQNSDLNQPTTQDTTVVVASCGDCVTPQEAVAEMKHRANPRLGHRRVQSEGEGELSPFLPPEVFQRLQTAVLQDMKKELTPIEEASLLNQKLKANYQARLARLQPGQATQKTSLKLSLQRQMMENLIIAKARQDALQRRMEERRLRLQEEANRRFAASGTVTTEEQEQRPLYTNVLEYEQDHDWPKLWKEKLKKSPDDDSLVSGLVAYLLSRADHPVMMLLKKHQYRIYNHLYPLVSRGPPASPSPTLKPSRSAQNLLNPEPHQKSGSDYNTSISSNEHNASEEELDSAGPASPGTDHCVDRENSFEDLEQFLTPLDWAPPHGNARVDSDLTFEASNQIEPESESIIHGLEVRALKEHLKDIVKDIHIAIDQLLSLCLLSFECLNTATSKDLCLASIEEAFFTPLWSPLLALFRKVNRDRELCLEDSMRLHHEVTPGDVGVSAKLFPQDPAVLHGSYPYECAVQELRSMCKDSCPQRKLECLVRTLRLICACAEDYRCLHEADSAPKTAAIGADDLLPILSFVALRCGCPQLLSECAALEEFIHEGYLIGEEGYCLTSMQSALTYVETLHTGGGLDKLT